MGHNNPFVTGEKRWEMDFKRSGVGLITRPTSPEIPVESFSDKVLEVRGNRNSKIYHLPGCPHYDRISERNVILFDSEAQAVESGYRKAGNCK
jgi:deoxyribonuclease-1